MLMQSAQAAWRNMLARNEVMGHSRAFRRAQRERIVQRTFEVEWRWWKYCVQHESRLRFNGVTKVADVDDVWLVAKKRADNRSMVCTDDIYYRGPLTRQERRAVGQLRDMLEEVEDEHRELEQRRREVLDSYYGSDDDDYDYPLYGTFDEDVKDPTDFWPIDVVLVEAMA